MFTCDVARAREQVSTVFDYEQLSEKKVNTSSSIQVEPG